MQSLSYPSGYVIFELPYKCRDVSPEDEYMKTSSKLNKLSKKNLQGQNVIEYLLVTTVVVIICIAFYDPHGGPARSALENIANDAVDDIARLNNEIQF